MKSRGAAAKRRPQAEEGDAAAKRSRGPGTGMVNFCPQCGQKVEEMFHFCPACGGRLPVQEEEPMQITPSPSLNELNRDVQAELPDSPDKKKVRIFFPNKGMSSIPSPQGSTTSVSPKAKGKAAIRSPKKEKCPCLKPLPEREILTDLNNKEWMIWKLLSQSDRGLMYEARLTSEHSPNHKYTLKLVSSNLWVRDSVELFHGPEPDFFPRLLKIRAFIARHQKGASVWSVFSQDTKEGKLFNEQNFLQRAAKKVTVQKWKKQYLMPFLGIPECVGFGVHGNSYRFLVFPELGRSLQSILDDNENKMAEKAVSQLAVRLLDVLEYLHENEYTHGDLAAENIYVNPADLTVVTLADFSFAFRYSPGGKHVPQRDCSRTPHEGNLEFISLDSHRGAAPSRRSDLESLGYCLVKWLCGALPWSAELADPCVVIEEKERCKADIIKSPRASSGWGALPESIKKYLQQVMTLEYEEKPNYEELRMLFTRPLQLMRASAYDSVDLRVAP